MLDMGFIRRRDPDSGHDAKSEKSWACFPPPSPGRLWTSPGSTSGTRRRSLSVRRTRIEPDITAVPLGAGQPRGEGGCAHGACMEGGGVRAGHRLLQHQEYGRPAGGNALSAMTSPASPSTAAFPSSARERTLKQFREGKLRVLVATDVAARGSGHRRCGRGVQL